MNPVAKHPGLFCKYIQVDESLSNLFQAYTTNSSRLHVLLSVSWSRKSIPTTKKQTLTSSEPHKASAVWSEDVSHQGFRACVLVSGRFLHEDLQPPSVHWSVFRKEFFSGDNDEPNIRVGSVHLDTWSTGTQCKTMFNISGNPSTTYNVFTSIELPGDGSQMSYKDAMAVWTSFDNYRSILKYVIVCARELQNFDRVHKGIIVVSLS